MYILIALVAGLLLVVGGLIGSTLTQQAMNGRSRRQALVQRQINEQFRKLSEMYDQLFEADSFDEERPLSARWR